ncbi:hypothetical protein ACH4Q7_34800 [Streptomyces roseolus]
MRDRETADPVLSGAARWTYRREVLPATYRAIAGLGSGRTANA